MRQAMPKAMYAERHERAAHLEHRLPGIARRVADLHFLADLVAVHELARRPTRSSVRNALNEIRSATYSLPLTE